MTRAEVARLYGGSTQGGIVPANQSNNVFIYSDPSRGEAYGYNFDGWDPDSEVFLYTGEGATGHQTPRRRNGSIANHRAAGRALRVFVGDGSVPGTDTRVHCYIGEFAVDPHAAYTKAQARDEKGDLRTVLVFRLHPVDGDYLVRPEDRSNVSDEDAVASNGMVPLEVNETDFYRVADVPSYVATRREAQLVERYRAHLKAIGHVAEKRWRIKPASQLLPLLTDLFDETAYELYEAKGTATRNDVRMAIGQLFDYRRHIAGELGLTVLVPEKPSRDVLDLIASVGFACVYEERVGEFRRASPS